MGIGDWQECIDFNARRIGDNIRLLKPQTIEAISHRIVDEAYQIEPDAVKKQRVDSFVVETDVHYPTESSLIVDGVRKITELCITLYEGHDIVGWRQHEHLLKKVKQINRNITRISARKGANYKQRMELQYRKLLGRAQGIFERAIATCETLHNEYELDFIAIAHIAEIKRFMGLTQQVCDTARRRVLEGEDDVPNEDKLFSIFENAYATLSPWQKQGSRNQFGRLVIVYEDAAGFISHHYVMPRDRTGSRRLQLNKTRIMQERLQKTRGRNLL